MPQREGINWPLLLLIGFVVYQNRKPIALPPLQAGRARMPRLDVEWSDADAKAFLAAVKAAGVPMDVVLPVYASESGLDPAASSGGSWGLPQFVKTTLRQLGWKRPPNEFAQLSVAEQSPWIARLLKSQVATLGRIPQTALDLYVLNFWPSAARRGEDVVLVRDSRDALERQAYAKNKNLDRGSKGYITRGDLQTSLDRVVHLPALSKVRAQIRRLAA